MRTLHKRVYQIEDLFLIQLYLCSKFCLSMLETLGLQAPTSFIRQMSLFTVCASNKYCPSARYPATSNVVCMKDDYLESKQFFLIIFYKLYFLITNY
jgi:hypothetical protein